MDTQFYISAACRQHVLLRYWYALGLQYRVGRSHCLEVFRGSGGVVRGLYLSNHYPSLSLKIQYVRVHLGFETSVERVDIALHRLALSFD